MSSEFTVNDLPDEVIEFILTFLTPYKDLQECMLVNKRWYRSVKNVIRTTRYNLKRAISEFNIRWQTLTPVDMAPTITKRYSHSACVHENSMYVFGGCTSSSTTFNDMWRLDLSKRQWVRPLTMGTYPSPKACATLTCYKDSLVLFGGWTHPSPYPLHQAWRLFNELHVYNITSNRWTCINTTSSPPPIAGHSVSVHGEWMILFGGLQRTNNPGQYITSNDVWCLNLETHSWYQPVTSDVAPYPRYGHSQIALNNDHVLIMGGCGGPNSMYHDVWVLKTSGEIWIWKKIAVRNKEWAPPHLWCNPACQVGERIVVLSRNPESPVSTPSYSASWNVPSQLRMNRLNVWVPPRSDDIPNISPRKPEPHIEKDENVNGRRGKLNVRATANIPSSSSDEEMEPIPGPSNSEKVKDDSISSGSSNRIKDNSIPSLQRTNFDRNNETRFHMSAFTDQKQIPNRNRERQLASLKRMEERIKNLSRRNNDNESIENAEKVVLQEIPDPEHHPVMKKPKRNVLGMYVLNISNVLNEEDPHVMWMPWKNLDASGGPEETILYTLVAGKGELVMFGGIQKDGTVLNCLSNVNVTNQVSNSLHFITAPKGII